MRTDLASLFRSGRPAALLILRLVIGFGFVAHGWAKLSQGPAMFAKLLEYIGVPLPHLMAWVVTLVELFGGASLMLGAFVALLSVPLLAVQLVALFTVHLPNGYSSVTITGLSADGPRFGPPGFEISLLYIAGILLLATSEPGLASLDRLFANAKAGRSVSFAKAGRT